GIAQLVEHNLAKVGVAGSSPVSRSVQNATAGAIVTGRARSPFCRSAAGVPGWRNGRRGGLKILCSEGACGFESRPGYAVSVVRTDTSGANRWLECIGG